MLDFKSHYDKILHVLGAFTALMWFEKTFSVPITVMIVVCLCILKSVWNYSKDRKYNPYGDWIANSIGFILWGLY